LSVRFCTRSHSSREIASRRWKNASGSLPKSYRFTSGIEIEATRILVGAERQLRLIRTRGDLRQLLLLLRRSIGL
jgi:hypothetical protein